MPRLQINLPEKFIFSTEIAIRIGDINRRDHLSNTAFLVIVEESRTRFLKSFGFSESEPDNIGFVISDTSIVYLQQGHYEQTLKIEIGVSDMTAKALNLVYRVSDSQTGEELARVKSGLLFYDYRQQKVLAIPHEIKEKLLK